MKGGAVRAGAGAVGLKTDVEGGVQQEGCGEAGRLVGHRGAGIGEVVGDPQADPVGARRP